MHWWLADAAASLIIVPVVVLWAFGDVRTIGRTVPKGQIVGICPSMRMEWSIHGYFMMNDRIALDASGSLSNEWFVADTTQCDPAPWYVLHQAATSKLRLYRAQ